jgi:hypothetical protein
MWKLTVIQNQRMNTAIRITSSREQDAAEQVEELYLWRLTHC